MDRLKAIIQRFEEELRKEGYEKKEIFERSKEGYGDVRSFFELLVDFKLEGKEIPTVEEMWTNMKKQLNEREGTIAYANEEYRKLSNRVRGLQNDYDALLREQQEQNKKKEE